MGCIFSSCKKDDINESFLLTKKHCMICNKVYSQNEYNKHIVKCKRGGENKL